MAPSNPDPTEQHDPAGARPRAARAARTAGLDNPEEMRDEPDHGEESYVGSGQLTDQAAIVTGADSGIGRAVALAFAREGADVVLSYLPAEEEDARDHRPPWWRPPGVGRYASPADLTEESACNELVETAVEELGRLDILVNNAAYQMSQPGGITDIDTEQLDRVMKTNLYALFWLCRAAVPHLRSGASIINTTSVSRLPSPAGLCYYLPGDEDQPLRAVLAVPGRHPSSGRRLLDREHHLRAGVVALAGAVGLRHHEGGHRQLHARPGRLAGRRTGSGSTLWRRGRSGHR